MKIKNLTFDINWRAVPKVIEREFAIDGHLREQTHRRNAQGKMDVTYGKIMRPIFRYYKYDSFEFYINEKFERHFDEPMDLGLVYDEDLNNITQKDLNPYYIEYAKGFTKGYNEFEDTLKKGNDFFGNSDGQMAHKVYSRITTDKKGSLPMYSTFDAKKTDLEKEICKEKGHKILFKINKKSFFNNGFEGGEFYKAWEIILENPLLFEPVFAKFAEAKELNKPQQNEPGEVYKTQSLFKVGLLFATGKMNKYFTFKGNSAIVANNGLSPLKIATELGNPSFEKIILASKNNYPTNSTNGNKNIFNNFDMMTKIIEHCEAKNLDIEPYFKSRLPAE